MIINAIKQHKILVIAFFIYAGTGIYNIDIAREGLINSWSYIKEMLEILPAVFVLAGLINIWVPPELIIRNFGKQAGIKGNLISIFIGSVSAGPIYAAFPVTLSLYKKGASLANTIIIISSWAVIKIPMLIVESKFLGLEFALTRYFLTIPGIIILGNLCEKLINKEKINIITKNTNSLQKKIIEILPGYNCGSCGYNSCYEYAQALINNNEKIDKCVPGKKEVQEKLLGLLN